LINLVLTEEQSQIVDSVGGFLTSELPVSRLRKAAPGADERQLWSQIAEMGIFGLGLSEDLGGAGFGIIEEVLVQRELGRNLIGPAVFATVTAAHVAVAAGNVDLARGIVSGTHRVAPLVGVAAGVGAGDYRLLDGEGADFGLLWSETEAVLVDLTTAGVREPVAGMHDRLALARVTLDGRAPVAATSDSAVLDRITLLGAANLAGASDGSRDLAVEYAKLREQFGKPIGAFQAIKHKGADMAVLSSVGWAQTLVAAHGAAAGSSHSAFACCAAMLLAAEAAVENAAQGIQIHGGIGFTDECDAHLFLKHAHVMAALFGAPRRQRRAILSLPEAA
jgi:alkylation response protein AidB-like acyl-CoA dehydrogenase